MSLPRRVKTVLVGASEPEVDPHLLLLDGRDVRSVNRAERRKHGFRGPAFTHQVPTLQRFVRRHADQRWLTEPRTRRQRKVRARVGRLVLRRGGLA